MGDFFSNVPAVITAVVVLAFLAFTGMRLGAAFLVRRIAGLFFVILCATFITFILGLLAPTDAIVGQLGQHFTPDQYNTLRHYYGLDLPWYQQYLNFLGRLLHGNLGMSYLHLNDSVNKLLERQVPVSLQLGLSSIVIAIVVGVTLGMVAGVRANTRYDSITQGIVLFLFSFPTFVIIPFYQIATNIMENNGIPHPPTTGVDWSYDVSSRIAPIIILALVQIAFYTRITRASMREVMRQDYIRTARAKGLPDQAVVWRHAFRNALIPIVTAIGPAIAFVVNGAFITESLFSIPGIGQTTLQATTTGDIPIILGTVLILALAVAFMNLVTDVAYGVIDPRIKSA